MASAVPAGLTMSAATANNQGASFAGDGKKPSGSVTPSAGAPMDTSTKTLSPLAQRALVMLRAQGIAIALCEGEKFICRATAGEIAPDVGVAVESEAGLTGECIRSGRLLLCNETAKDARVNPSVAQAGIHGVLVSPVLRGDSVLGVLEAFWSTPQTLSTPDQHVANSLAAEIAGVLPQSHAGWKIVPLQPAKASEPAAVPAFLNELSLPQPRKSRRGLWIASAVVGLAGIVTTVGIVRHETAIPVPAPVSETSEVNRRHLEVIKESAEQGNVGAQSILALFYWTGRGVKQDNEAAYMWSAIAAENGDANSAERLKLLRAAMPAESITRAEANKKKWLREHGAQEKR